MLFTVLFFLLSAGRSAPVIVQPQLSRIATIGQAVRFEIGATGEGTLRYQWRRNGLEIAGATQAVFSLPSVALSDRGFYEVLVGDASGGSARSVFHFNVGYAETKVVAWGPMSNGVSEGVSDGLSIARNPNGSHALVLRSNGRVAAWGGHHAGAITVPEGLDAVVGVAGSLYNSLAVRGDGTVVYWGLNEVGASPPTPLDQVVAVAAGASLHAALRRDGTVVAWGASSGIPFVERTFMTDIVAIASGGDFLMGLRNDGRVVVKKRAINWSMEPPATLTDVVAIAAGTDRCLALRRDGGLVIWGGDYMGSGKVPADLGPVHSVAAGPRNTFVIKPKGLVAAWGYGPENETSVPEPMTGAFDLGFCLALVEKLPPTIQVKAPPATVVAGGFLELSAEISGAPPFTFQWLRNGTPLADGSGRSGTTTARLSLDPVGEEDAGSYVLVATNVKGQVQSTAVTVNVLVPPRITRRPLTQLVQLGQPLQASVEATDSGPITYQWKHNGRVLPSVTGATLSVPAVAREHAGRYEVLLTGAAASVRSVFFVNVTSLPLDQLAVCRLMTWDRETVVVNSGQGVVALAAGNLGAVSLQSDGSVKYLLPSGSVPLPEGLDQVVAVGVGDNHGVALRADGTVRVWENPQVRLAEHAKGLRDVVDVYTGGYQLHVRFADGSIRTLGASMPAVDLTGVEHIAVGSSFSVALKTDGSLAVWGDNQWGQCNLPSDLGPVKQIAAGNSHVLAVRSDGALRSWGARFGGPYPLPAAVSEGTQLIAGSSSYLLESNGLLREWSSKEDRLETPNVVAAAVSTDYVHLLMCQGPSTATIDGQVVQVIQGEPASISMAFDARRRTPLTWYKDGVPLSGVSTTTLTIDAVGPEHAGVYSARQVAGIPTGPSEPTTLLMRTRPEPEGGSPLITWAAIGSTLQLQAATVFEASGVRWMKNGQAIPGATSTTLPLGVVGTDTDAVYQAEYTLPEGVTYLRQYSVRVRSPESTAVLIHKQSTDPIPQGLKDVLDVATGGSGFGLALKADGTVVGWGSNPGTNPLVPEGLSDVVALAAGYQHAVAIKRNGTVVAWGDNSMGQTNVPAGLRDCIAVVANGYKSYVLRSDGRVFGWGDSGEAAGAIPKALNRVMTLVCRYDATLALRTDGSLRAWGNGANSVRGIDPGRRDLTHIALGENTGLAIDREGKIVMWGDTVNVFSPLDASVQPARQLAADYPAGLALGRDNRLRRWGGTAIAPDPLRDGLDAVLQLDRGVYPRCVVVAKAPAAPRIVSQVETVTVRIGQEAVLSVTAEAVPAPDFIWYKNGERLSDVRGMSGYDTGTLRIAQALPQDAGVYTVEARNREGSVVSRSITVSVLTGSITASAEPRVGSDVSLTVQCPEAVSYQWRFRGATIAGATGDTLTLRGLSRYDNGVYDVVVTTPQGTLSVAPYQLEVVPARMPDLYLPSPTFAPVFEREGRESVRAALVQPDGKMLIGGDFTRLDGRPCFYLARLNVDGTLDTAFAAPRFSGPIHVLLRQPDGTIYVGGDFSFVNGKRSGGIVRLTAAYQVDETFDVGIGFAGQVLALLRQEDGKILVGGLLGSFKEETCYNLHRLLADGRRDETFAPSTSGIVRGLLDVGGGKILYYGESYDRNNKSPKVGMVAHLSTAGGSAAWGYSAYDGAICALARQADGSVLIGLVPEQQYGNRMLRLKADGSPDSGWLFDPELFATTKSVTFILALPDGKCLVAGKGLPLTRLDATGRRDAGFTPFGGELSVFAVDAPAGEGGRRLAGCFAGSGDGALRAGWLSLAADGSRVASQAGVAVQRAAVLHEVRLGQGGSLYVRGDFTQVNQARHPGLVRLKRDGTVDSGFGAALAPDPSGTGKLWLQGDGRIIVYADGALRRLNADGSVDATFAPVPFAGGVALLEADGRLLFAEPGSYAESGITGYLKRASPSGIIDPGFAMPYRGALTDLASQWEGRVVLCGALSKLGEETLQSHILHRMMPDGSRDLRFSLSAMPDWLQPASRGSLFLIQSMIGAQLLKADGLYALPNPLPSVVCDLPDGRFLAADLPGVVVALGHGDRTLLGRYTSSGGVDKTLKINGLDAWRTDIRQIMLEDDGSLLLRATQFEAGGAPGFGLMRLEEAYVAQISAAPTSCTGELGGRAVFSVTASGSGPLSYQWYRDGWAMPGATSASLVLQPLQPSDIGRYTVRVSNVFGSILSSAASLTGSKAVPVIVAQPKTTTITSGATATFSVQANPGEAGGTLGYQWCREGFPIPGATQNTYVLSGARLADAGFYEVIVNDGLTSVRSDSVRLTVEPTRYLRHLVPDTTFKPLVEQWGGTVKVLLPLPDGRCVVSGSFTRISGFARPGLARLDAQQQVDASFAPPASLIDARAFAVMADGRVIVGVHAPSQSPDDRSFLLVRLLADGSLDTSFNCAVEVGAVTQAALRPDGTLVVVPSYPLNGRSSLYRLRTDGSVDAAFAPAFTVFSSYDPTHQPVSPTLMTAMPDGNVVCYGVYTHLNGVPVSKWITLNSAGAVVAGVGGAQPGNIEEDAQILPMEDGSLLVGGRSLSTEYGSRQLVRLLPNGTVDGAFGRNFWAGGVLRLARTAGAGTVIVYSNNGYKMALLDAAGDATEEASLDLPQFNAKAAAILSRHQCLFGGAFGGSEEDGAMEQGAALRILRLRTDQPTMVETNTALQTEKLGGTHCGAVDREGRILLGGNFSRIDGLLRPGLARLLPDGRADVSFGNEAGFDRRVLNLLVQPDGTVVVSGSFQKYQGAAVNPTVRLLPNGSLDRTFVAPPSVAGELTRMPGRKIFVGRGVRLCEDGSVDSGAAYLSEAEKVTEDEGRGCAALFYRTQNGSSSYRLEFYTEDGTLKRALGLASHRYLIQSGGQLLTSTLRNTIQNGYVQTLPQVLRHLPTGARDMGFAGTDCPPTTASAGNNQELSMLLEIGFGRILVYNWLGMYPYDADGRMDPNFSMVRVGRPTEPGNTYVMRGFRRVLSLDDGRLLVLDNGCIVDGRLLPGLLMLTATDVPVLQAMPATSAAIVGQAWSLKAAPASGGGEVQSYQWFRNGVALDGQTSDTLQLAAAAASDAGVYAVRVEGPGGLLQTSGTHLVVEPDNKPPVMTRSPEGMTVFAGETATLSAEASGTAPLIYVWEREGVAVSDDARVKGSRTATLRIEGAQKSDGGLYRVKVSNAFGEALSGTGRLAVLPAGVAAAHTSPGWSAGEPVTVTTVVTHGGDATRLAVAVLLPEGWTYASGAGEPAMKPKAGDAGTLSWTFEPVPPSPVTFSYTLNVPAGQTGVKSIAGTATLTYGANEPSLLIKPDPLLLRSLRHHSADTDNDWRIGSAELLRVLQLYETRKDGVRTGAYGLNEGTPDGFAPDAMRGAQEAATLLRHHSGDTDRDGRLSVSELTRMIQLYNTREGAARTGQYHLRRTEEPLAEDGFVPGP